MGHTITADIDDQLEAAWTSLLGRSDAIADSIAATLLERDAEQYQRGEPGLAVDVRKSTRDHVRLGLLSLSGSQASKREAVELWRETGRTRARQNVPMELVLNAYTLGTRVLWESLLEAHHGGLEVGNRLLVAAGQQIWSALDVQNGVLIESYRRESSRLQRRNLNHQQGVLAALVEGRGADPEYAAEALEILGIEPDLDVACVVAPYDGALEEPLPPLEGRLERQQIVSHWYVRAGVYFGLLAGHLPGEDELVELLIPHAAGRVGLARCADGLAGFATAFSLASRAAETVSRSAPTVVAVSARLPEVLLAGSPAVAALIQEQTLAPLGALPDHQAQTLIETLRVLLAHDGSPKHAAEELFCHRNTVIYRIKQIEQITKRRLADPRDRMLLWLGLMAAGY